MASPIDRLKRAPGVRWAFRLQERYNEHGVGLMTAAVAYYAFVSVFPLLLVGASVIGFLLAGDPGAQREWAQRLGEGFPGVRRIAGSNIQALVDARAGTGIVGLLGLLWSGTAMVKTAARSLGRIFGVTDEQNFLQSIAWALGATLALGALAIAGAGLAVTVPALPIGGLGGVGVKVIGGLVTFGINFVLFAIAYRILVKRPGPSLREVWPGAALAAAGWSLLLQVGSLLATRTITRYEEFFGALASALAAIVVLYLAARIFMYGGVLNAVLIDRRKEEQMATAEHPAGQDRPGQAAGTADGRSTAELLRSVALDSSALIRKEVELARHEIVEAATARLRGAAALGAAGVLGIITVWFLGLGAVEALARVVERWAAALIVGGGFGLLAAAAASGGLLRMRRPPLTPTETVRTVKEDVQWARAQLKR